MKVFVLSLLITSFFFATAGEPGMIRLNQVGFYPKSPKIAVVLAPCSSSYKVTSLRGDLVFFTGKLGEKKHWAPSGEDVCIADFTEFTRPGQYKLIVENLGESYLLARRRPFLNGDTGALRL